VNGFLAIQFSETKSPSTISIMIDAMRTFIVIGHKASTSPDFSLEDIPGTSGRLDILCRCINSAFVLSHGIRHDVRIFLVLCGGEIHKTICLRGEDLRHLNPDERTTAALLRKALAIDSTPQWKRSTPGIYIREGGLETLMEMLGDSAILYYLREDGMEIRDLDLDDGAVFVLGDHLGMSEEEEEILENKGAAIISVSPLSLHADHCIVLVNNELDRK
jgi:tRNA (pseudouridine54-N1)-methyltransferase